MIPLRSSSGSLFLLGAGNVAVATSVPMTECANCTQAQMLAKAKNHAPGIVFVYDLAHDVIRKFEAFSDSTCGTGPGTHKQRKRRAAAPGRRQQRRRLRVLSQCGRVDARRSRHSGHLRFASPGLADQSGACKHAAMATRVGPPVDPNTHQPFNLARVAFDYPQLSFVRFKELIRDEILIKIRLTGHHSFPTPTAMKSMG